VTEHPRCQYCGAAIEGKPAVCTACDTPHHRDCFEENGRCTTYACACTSFFDGATSVTVHLGGRSDDVVANGFDGWQPPVAGGSWTVGGLILALVLTGVSLAISVGRPRHRKAVVVEPRTAVPQSVRPRSMPPRTGRIDWSDVGTQKGTLMKAIVRRDLALARRMLSYGCPVNERWGSSHPLDLAASTGNRAMVELLVAHGAVPRDARVAERVRNLGVSLDLPLERPDD